MPAISISSLRDVAAAKANRDRLTKADSNVQFINLNGATLDHLPGLKSRFTDILNAVEDMRQAMEATLKAAGKVPAGHVVTVTKSKRGWLCVVGEPLAQGQRHTGLEGIADIS